MLVDDKFLFISIPRCASHSFVIGCGFNKIKNEYVSNRATKSFNKMNWENLNFNNLYHPHETISDLEDKFGHNYEIISIKRDRHQRFVSLWRHTLNSVKIEKDYYTFNKMINLEENEIFDFQLSDLNEIDNFAKKFIVRHKLNLENKKLKSKIEILFTPTSKFHNFDNRILWFEINKLKDLEDWVSEKLKLKYKIPHTNSSDFIDSKLRLSDGFIEKYNSIYNNLDFHKTNKTLI